MTKIETDTIRLQTAMTLREQAIKDFVTLCAAARIHPVHVDKFGENLKHYKDASDAVYQAMWMAAADTGMKVTTGLRLVAGAGNQH